MKKNTKTTKTLNVTICYEGSDKLDEANCGFDD